MKRQGFGILLTMLMSMTSIAAFAYDAKVNGIYYNFSGTEATVTYLYSSSSGNSNSSAYSGSIVIPETVTYNGTTYSVTSIGNSAFYSCRSLTSLSIPSSVTSIGRAAFVECSGLTSIVVEEGNTVYDSRNNCNAIIRTSDNTLLAGCKNTDIPSSVTSIGDNAFSGCWGLTSLTIPSGVTSIGGGAFYGCSGLTSVTIPSSVTSIGGSAFNFCSGLTSVAIPSSVTSIGYCAFSYCPSLTSIVVEDGNTVYDSRNNCNAIIRTSDNTLLAGCMNTEIPSNVTSISDEAFYFCHGLKSLTIPSSVTSIGYRAFTFCRGLTSLTIPSSVTSIGDEAFLGCSGFPSLTIPSSVTSIGNGAFSKSGLTSIVVEDGNTVYDSRNNCNAIIRTSDNTLLAGCKNSEIPLGVTSIGDMAFSWSGLTSLTIPSSVTSIGNNAFDGCSGLTSLTIPSSVTSIGDNAFYSCSGLTSVIVGWDSPLVIGNSVFSSSNNQNVTLYVPKGTKAAYEAAAVWQNFGDIKEKLDKSDGAVSDSQGIRYTANDDESTCYVSGHDDTYSSDIIIPNTFKGRHVTSIDEYAFYKCSGLTSVTIPEGVTSIGDGAFQGCSGLTSIVVEEGNTFYDSRNNCNAIIRSSDNTLLQGCKNTEIPSSVTSIGVSAFWGCSGLTSVTIPSSVTSIGEYAFSGCSGLTSVTFPSSVTSIGDGAFQFCI